MLSVRCQRLFDAALHRFEAQIAFSEVPRESLKRVRPPMFQVRGHATCSSIASRKSITFGLRPTRQ